MGNMQNVQTQNEKGWATKVLKLNYLFKSDENKRDQLNDLEMNVFIRYISDLKTVDYYWIQ